MSRMRAACRSAAATSPERPGARAHWSASDDRLAPPGPLRRPAHEPRGEGFERAPLHGVRGLERLAREAHGQPLAHPLSRHRHLRGPEDLHQGVDDQAAPHHRVPAVGVQAGDPGALLDPVSRQSGRDVVQPPSRKDVPVQARDRVARASLVDLREVAQGAPGAHQLLSPGEGPQPRRVQDLAGVLAQPPHLPLGRRVRAEERVGDPQGAQGHAERAEQPAVAEASHLQAAAAEVEEGPVVHRQPPDRAEKPVPGLLDPRERADGEAELALDPPDERRAVRRVPQGRGARGHDPPHPGTLRDRAEVPKGQECALERLRGDPPGLVELAHEPQRGAAAREDPQVPAGLVAVHHHAARVRADVDHRHGRRRSIAPGRTPPRRLRRPSRRGHGLS